MAEAQAPPEPQSQPQPEPQSDNRLAEEQNTSKKKSSDEAIKAIYKVISKYNGIVRKIMETIEPVKGPWSTRKSVDQSTISYYAQVLKGLIEPLKHLMFQLSKVNDPTLSSMMSMMDNLIKMIDMAPPFTMIDSSAYKEGTFDYTGFNDDMNVGSLTDYINLLTLKMKSLKNTRDIYDASKKGHIKSLPPDRRANIKELMDKTFNNYDVAMDKVADELLKAKEDRKNKLKVFEINQDVINALKLSEEEINELDLPNINRDNLDTSEDYKFMEGLANKSKVLVNNDKEQINKKKALLKTVKGIIKSYTEKGTKDGVFDLENLANENAKKEYGDALNKAARLQRELAKGDIEFSKEDVGDGKGACGSGACGSGACGSGAGIDVNVVQQYNMMGRPVSNDQKINNDMINANRNWQINNNGPHDTPIGNLNPFLAQNDASKYTYEVMLAKQNAEIHPEVNALGANISLLQGPITNMSGSGKKSKAMDKISKVAIDEKNDMHKPMEMGDKGYIPEEKEDQFKLPDLKLKKKK